jgi:hypothetical protein
MPAARSARWAAITSARLVFNKVGPKGRPLTWATPRDAMTKMYSADDIVFVIR